MIRKSFKNGYKSNYFVVKKANTFSIILPSNKIDEISREKCGYGSNEACDF